MTADGSATLFSERYAQAFASRRGALGESQGVFLEASGAARRLAEGRPVGVLEVGFGTGLNFFVTAGACLAHPEAKLAYTALEHHLLPAEAVSELGYGALLNTDVVAHYLEWRVGLREASGKHTFERDRVRLELWLGDAPEQVLPENTFSTVYHDGFSPDVNPEVWTEAFLGRLVSALAEGGTLVSYCVQGAVRRRLAALGLEVSKRPGPVGGKREVLFSRKPASRKPGP